MVVLDALPVDVLSLILLNLPPDELVLTVALCSRAFHAAAAQESIWRNRLHLDYPVIISQILRGICPPPKPPTTWMAHYFEFASTWMAHTRDMGLVIVKIDGVVHDVTSYMNDHPGEPELVSQGPPRSAFTPP